MFEIVSPLTVDPTTAGNGEIAHLAHSHIEGANSRDRSPHKIVLPRRPGAPRFGPQSYYYEASPTVPPACCQAGIPALSLRRGNRFLEEHQQRRLITGESINELSATPPTPSGDPASFQRHWL